MIIYPVRLLGYLFDTNLLFEILVLPTLCVLYNQVTLRRGLWPAFYYALLFSAGITALEYLIELYTDLIEYISWSWFFTLTSLTGVFILSRVFLVFFRWGCRRFGRTA
ncbi:hypothetical protein SAMN05660706_11774 [Desulfoscipio geothermicus DSM 3669]|uniref:Uncharacterized protein n=2 Tax=Desulfoscipio geothermicus TaxID=39060 RepID=A0A1I6DTW7_9FIRM|nr:hypothetical protein SAMN05660706_11774 [Desulfoscipio geothermicus DSM 3669]